MTPAQALVRLVEMGLPRKQMAAAAELLEAVAVEGLKALEARRMADRERQQRLRTGLSRDRHVTGDIDYIIPVITKLVSKKERKKDTSCHVTSRDEDPPGFGLFWPAYPKHEDRKVAVRAFIKACVRAPVKEIIDGAVRYKAHCKTTSKEAQFIKLAATWLNGDCWKNIYKPERGKLNAVEQLNLDIEERERREAEACGKNGTGDSEPLSVEYKDITPISDRNN